MFFCFYSHLKFRKQTVKGKKALLSEFPENLPMFCENVWRFHVTVKTVYEICEDFVKMFNVFQKILKENSKRLNVLRNLWRFCENVWRFSQNIGRFSQNLRKCPKGAKLRSSFHLNTYKINKLHYKKTIGIKKDWPFLT